MLSIFSYHLVVLLTDAYFSYMQLILVSKNVNITLYVLCEDIFFVKDFQIFPTATCWLAPFLFDLWPIVVAIVHTSSK